MMLKLNWFGGGGYKGRVLGVVFKWYLSLYYINFSMLQSLSFFFFYLSLFFIPSLILSIHLSITHTHMLISLQMSFMNQRP